MCGRAAGSMYGAGQISPTHPKTVFLKIPAAGKGGEHMHQMSGLEICLESLLRVDCFTMMY